MADFAALLLASLIEQADALATKYRAMTKEEVRAQYLTEYRAMRPVIDEQGETV